jgi:hypothetical protein
MHAAPVLRGGRVARSARLVCGLFLCAWEIVAFLESRLGLPPWNVVHVLLPQPLPAVESSFWLVTRLGLAT